MNVTAIIGSTCSGKSALALKLAMEFDLDIFSIDSLSVYKYVDIASAKPNKEALDMVKHYGVNMLEPSERCNVKLFFDLLKNVINRRILIVGGSSFYLKTIIDGLVPMPPVTKDIQDMVSNISLDKIKAFNMLNSIDSEYADRISVNDSYRISRGLEIFFLTNMPPSLYFKVVPREKLQFDISIFELVRAKDLLISSIESRTKEMINRGLIDEVLFLKNRYQNSHIFKAIGIKEVISYINGCIDINEMEGLINRNTIALAKRQKTFNKTQFSDVISGDEQTIISNYASRI